MIRPLKFLVGQWLLLTLLWVSPAWSWSQLWQGQIGIENRQNAVKNHQAWWFAQAFRAENTWLHHDQDFTLALQLRHEDMDEREALLDVTLDRLHWGGAEQNLQWQLGRQARTWGSGVFFNPLDFWVTDNHSGLTPLYKPGVDLIWLQNMQSWGNWEAMGRFADDEGWVTAQRASLMLKAQGQTQNSDLQFIGGLHGGMPLVAGGGSYPLGEDLLQMDWVSHFVHGDFYHQVSLQGLFALSPFVKYPSQLQIQLYYSAMDEALLENPTLALDPVPWQYLTNSAYIQPRKAWMLAASWSWTLSENLQIIPLYASGLAGDWSWQQCLVHYVEGDIWSFQAGVSQGRSHLYGISQTQDGLMMQVSAQW